MINKVALVFCGCLLAACSSKTELNKFSDLEHVQIANLQDHRYTDSLYNYFKHENPAYRKDAVLAFASIQDSTAVDKLGEVLKTDADPAVRKAAAIALGQIPALQSVAILREALTREKDNAVLKEVIESCGKVFRKEHMNQIEMSSSDTLVQEALAWACYRLGLRGLADSALTVKAVGYLNSTFTPQTRLGAANYFARGGSQLNFVEQQLIASAQQDPSPWVRAGVTSGLRKIKTDASQQALLNILKTDADYRVRISAVRSLQAFPIEKVKEALFAALRDANINVAIASAEILRNVATEAIETEIVKEAKASKNWRVSSTLYEAALSVTKTSTLVDEVKQAFAAEQNVYGKAGLLTALGQAPTAWSFINDQLHQASTPVIKSSAATALVAINSNAAFDKSIQTEYVEVYKKAIETGDAAVIGTIAAALMDPKLNYKTILSDYKFLHEAKAKLSLPKDNEALQPLEAAIAYFEGKEVTPVKNEFNHPIDWALVKTIPADQKVLIKTSKGDIVLKLLVEKTPGSVANFVQLVNSHYFDAKNFHRVVPNFVIQGGCNRGDGWGSEDYSIRSEFTDRHYTEGSVGMASAGKDTEGTQWFITHSPTPHLDGRYTIFAVTLSGIDVVHRIEVGDKIVSVALID